MKKEEAKKAAEVMLAYADGKEIECRDRHESQWREAKEPGFDWDYFEFRVKPQPKYRPFKDAEECWREMQKHQPFGWVRFKGDAYPVVTTIGTLYKDELEPTDRRTFSYSESFDSFTFVDGTPFGAKEEEV